MYHIYPCDLPQFVLVRMVQKLIQKNLDLKGILYSNNTEIVSVRVNMKGQDSRTYKKYLIANDGKEFHYHEAIWCTDVSPCKSLFRPM
jgi:hypothetical protein